MRVGGSHCGRDDPMGFRDGASGKEFVCQCRRHRPWGLISEVRFLDQENYLKKGMATHSNILTLRIPWTEESGGLQCMGSQRVRHV